MLFCKFDANTIKIQVFHTNQQTDPKIKEEKQLQNSEKEHLLRFNYKAIIVKSEW